MKLLEFERDTEIIKGKDLKQSLNNETNRNLDYIEKYNQEKQRASSVQEQLDGLKNELSKIKEHFEKETKNFHLVW